MLNEIRLGYDEFDQCSPKLEAIAQSLNHFKRVYESTCCWSYEK